MFCLLTFFFLDLTASVERGRHFLRSQQAGHGASSSWRAPALPPSGRDARFRPARMTSEDRCETCHAARDEWLVRLYRESTHGRRRLACTSCHGGDSSTSDQRRAHAEGFVGRPTPSETLAMCRPCHPRIVEVFTASRHYRPQQGGARLDCVQCHGAHAMGGAQPNMSFAYTCAGCHGLEYLPALPPEFQRLLQTRDEVTPLLVRADTSSTLPGRDVQDRRRQIRAGIAALVHATDTDAAPRQIPDLLRRMEELKRLLQE